MKKMFFTAILVIAFSGASTAKNVEVKETVKVEDSKTEMEEVLVNSCVDLMLDAYETVMSIRNNGKEDWLLLNNLLSHCIQ